MAQRCYPPVSEADFAGPMETVMNLYSQPMLRAIRRSAETSHPNRCEPTSGRRRPRARAVPPPTTTHTRGAAPAPSGCSWNRCPWRTANATARRTGADWARQVQTLADHPRDRQAARPAPGLRPSEYPCLRPFLPGFSAPPQHWLNGAEPELSVLTRQAAVPAQVPAWAEARNAPTRASTGSSAPPTPAYASRSRTLSLKHDRVLPQHGLAGWIRICPPCCGMA